jgi:peptidoglycan/LPS O-acetylase OafA/YrhL
LLVLVALPAIVALASVAKLPQAIARVSARLGDASYAFYALHAPAIALASLAVFGTAEGAFTAAQTAGLAIATFIVALIANAWFDAPIRKRLAAVWRRGAARSI